MTTQTQHRLATTADIPEIERIMDASMSTYLPQTLSAEQAKASREVMGLDTQLIEDQTYFLILRDGEPAGCGGWSMRKTLFGGDHSAGRSAERLDPSSEAARIRAMYVDPSFGRSGIGRYLLALCEAEALAAGFRRAELAATMSGKPLYEACGYELVRHFDEMTSSGIAVPLATMAKSLDPATAS